MIPEYLLAKIEKSDVIYRCIGNEMKNGILACGFMRKETADRSQYHFSNEYYSCFVLLRGSGEYIAEDGSILAETAPFAGDYAETELDCQRMEAERARNTSFEHTAEGYITVEFDLSPEETVLTRRIDPAPFVPGDPQRRAARCELILKMQADGLAKRLEHAHAKTAVIGISGGLDSCLALLVAVRAMKQLHRPAADVLMFAHRYGEKFHLLTDPAEGVKDADVVVTSAWNTAPGTPESERRLRDFAGFQVTSRLMEGAKPDAMLLHCLPAHRGEEISTAVFEEHADEIFAEAENRLHVQKAVLAILLAGL